VSRPECPLWPGTGVPYPQRAPHGEGIAQNGAEQGQQFPLAAVEGGATRRGSLRVGGGNRTTAAPLRAFIYGVIVVANASVRLFVSPLLVCMKNDLNAVPLFASPW
jgi:hypothetical protein